MLSYYRFPPADTADEHGLVCVSESINSLMVESAYRQGIFPWPGEWSGELIPWFSPDPRSIITKESFRVPSRVRRYVKKLNLKYVWNRHFDEIIRACSEVDYRKYKEGSWITPDLQGAYQDLFKLGKAFCVAALEDNKLVAGLYGVKLESFYSAESMFFTRPNASKGCLIEFFETVLPESNWVDIQVETPTTHQFGAIAIPREDYIWELAEKFR